MTVSGAAMTWFVYLEPIATAALRNLALITLSPLLILGRAQGSIGS